jgi:hypothetical protein
LIRWPDGYKPEQVGVHARTEAEMPATSETVWRWLVRAELWPSWYADFRDVVIEGGGPDLGEGSRFRWRAFGVTLNSRVEEFEPFQRLAWGARAMGIDAYHAWLLEDLPSGGCRVLTEETQNGWVARLNDRLRPRFMSTMQRLLLERLLERSKDGPP